MSTLKLAVLRQVAYAHSIRDFIRAILEKLIPGKWIDRVFAADDAEFNARLDAAFAAMDVATATKDDYRKSVVKVLCDEVSRLCEVLKATCEGRGYGEYFESHISHERFVRLVLSVDSVKLGRMKKIVADETKSPIDILRGIGAVLNDEPIEERAALCARERRRANAEVLKVVKATKKTLVEKVDAASSEIVKKMDAVAADVKEVQKRMRNRKTARRQFSAKQVEAASTAWRLYNESEAAHMNENTRPTYKAAFDHSRSALEAVGVDSVETFRRIMHSVSVQRSRENAKAIEAKREAWRKKQSAAR